MTSKVVTQVYSLQMLRLKEFIIWMVVSSTYSSSIIDIVSSKKLLIDTSDTDFNYIVSDIHSLEIILDTTSIKKNMEDLEGVVEKGLQLLDKNYELGNQKPQTHIRHNDGNPKKLHRR